MRFHVHILRKSSVKTQLIIIVIPTSFVSTSSYCCKHFGIPKVCTFTWCTSNMVQ